jgi:hypothetical protein
LMYSLHFSWICIITFLYKSNLSPPYSLQPCKEAHNILLKLWDSPTILQCHNSEGYNKINYSSGNPRTYTDVSLNVSGNKHFEEIGTRTINWAQLSRFYLKTKTEPSLRNAVFEIKRRWWIMSRNI